MRKGKSLFGKALFLTIALSFLISSVWACQCYENYTFLSCAPDSMGGGNDPECEEDPPGSGNCPSIYCDTTYGCNGSGETIFVWGETEEGVKIFQQTEDGCGYMLSSHPECQWSFNWLFLDYDCYCVGGSVTEIPCQKVASLVDCP